MRHTAFCCTFIGSYKTTEGHERPRFGATLFCKYTNKNHPCFTARVVPHTNTSEEMYYSPPSSASLFVNVSEATALETPSLMAMALTVVVASRVMGSLYTELALVGVLPSVV